MTPNTIVRCIDDRQSDGRLVKGRLYVVSKFDTDTYAKDLCPSIPSTGVRVQVYGVVLPDLDGILSANRYWKSSRFVPINRKDLETELLAKVADKIVGANQ